MLYYDLQIYKDFSTFSSGMHKRIRRMPCDIRSDLGDELRRAMRSVRLTIYEVNSHQDADKAKFFAELKKKLVYIKILIDDGLDSGAFSLTGKKNMVEPIKQLRNIMSQSQRWEKAISDRLAK